MNDKSDNRRYDFSPTTISNIKQRAAFICSNPACKLVTIGPSEVDENMIQYNGKVSHILPASKGGPRDLPGTTPEQRMAPDNAIFLCSSCGDLIDKNKGVDYPIEVLKKWKEEHEKWTLSNLNKQFGENSTIINLGNNFSSNGGTQNIFIAGGSPQKDKGMDHDLELYKRLELVLDEANLMFIVNSLKDYHKCYSSHQDQLNELIDFLMLSKNSFLDSSLDESSKKYLKALKQVMQVIDSKFDRYPYNQTREDFKIELSPRLIHYTGFEITMEDRLQYDKDAEMLRIALDTLSVSYEEFRKLVKKTVFY